ncbi:MAG TPA: hypothetical protein VH000_09915 [Rhizomicrobium sp.]|nr:hypothetical protein [Rhizomicrobium sp.]HEX4534534.1 hypothetical protein [Rhizomicrobium sp.]
MRPLFWIATAVFCTLILAAAFLWANLYQMAAASQYQAWRLNSLTGAVSYCGLVDHKLVCIPVPDATITPKKK